MGMQWAENPYMGGAMNPAFTRGDISETNLMDMYTPRQLFGQFATGFRPGLRQGMWNVASPMEAMWRLGGVQTPGASGFSPLPNYANFRDYLQNVPGGVGYSPMLAAGSPTGTQAEAGVDRAGMMARAREAARIAGLATSSDDPSIPNYEQELAGITDRDRAIAFAAARDRYAGENAAANQLAAAQALARMRGGGQGYYGGEVGRGIERSLSEIMQSRLNRGYTPDSFLGWYTGLARNQ